MDESILLTEGLNLWIEMLSDILKLADVLNESFKKKFRFIYISQPIYIFIMDPGRFTPFVVHPFITFFSPLRMIHPSHGFTPGRFTPGSRSFMRPLLWIFHELASKNISWVCKRKQAHESLVKKSRAFLPGNWVENFRYRTIHQNCVARKETLNCFRVSGSTWDKSNVYIIFISNTLKLA